MIILLFLYSFSPTYPQQGKKMYFNMANKIQIIPHNRQGQLNTTFLATVPGVLKIAEIVRFLTIK